MIYYVSLFIVRFVSAALSRKEVKNVDSSKQTTNRKSRSEACLSPLRLATGEALHRCGSLRLQPHEHGARSNTVLAAAAYPATTRINGTISRARLANPQSTATPRMARFTLFSFCISPLLYLTPAAPILMAGELGWHTAGTPSQRKNDIMGHQFVNPD